MESGTDQTAEGSKSPAACAGTMITAGVTMSILAVTLLLAGCGRGVMMPHYYALEIPPAPERTLSGAQLPGTVVVGRFDTPSYLRQGRIVYRVTPEEIGFYDYHRWAADPAETVTKAMIDALRSGQLFSFVQRYDGRSRGDYLMTGRLDRLEEIDYGGRVRVQARISAELVNLRTGATAWTGDAAEMVNVKNRDVGSVVRAMDGAVEASIDQLTASLNQRLIAK